MRRAGAGAATAGAACCGIYIVSDVERKKRGVALAEASWRAARLAAVAGLIAADYKSVEWRMRVKSTLSSPGRENEQKRMFTEAEEELEVADAAAKAAESRLADAIRRNAPTSERKVLQREAKAAMDVAAEKAEIMVATKRDMRAEQDEQVYIKLAQHLAQMDYLLPEEYTHTLKSCLDDAPRSNWEDVKETIREELGGSPADVFDSFDQEPIASASLAQVHTAMLGGKKVAVKVQHRGLRETSRGDVDAVGFAVKVLSSIFPSMPLWWIADELAPNLHIELNFLSEAKNAERCREMFRGDNRIVVPEILHQLSTSRVLCMSFEEGCTSVDVSAISSMGISSRQVAALISEVFCKQIFLHHFVHCDPHPANILVRRHPNKAGSPQLVILDHGLYRELDEDFVRNYSLLWRALVFGDVQMIRRQCQIFGAGEMYPLLAAMLTARPWNNIIDTNRDALRLPDTEEEKEKIKTYAVKYAIDITRIMNKVPRQMLLLFKANDCLRHLDRRLGSPINTLHITARISNMSIAKSHSRQGLVGWARGLADSWRVEFTLLGWWLLSKYNLMFSGS